MLKSFFSLSFEQLVSFLKENEFKTVHAQKIFKEVYKNDLKRFQDIEYLPQELSTLLAQNFSLELPKIINAKVSSDDQTVKFLTMLHDGNTVETVLVPFHKKYTICLSSQVGCAMKCSFCFTGTQGLKRNLESFEIVTQYLSAFRYIKTHYPTKKSLPNIVFMGQGEPLHNFEEVKSAIKNFLCGEALNLGPRQITLSTAGHLPGLQRFSELGNINIALSFHSPFNTERSELIPLNNKYPIEEIINVLKTIPLLKRQFLTFEYLILRDKNHSDEHVKKIASLLSDLPVIFNLIPFNEFPGCSYKRPLDNNVEIFKQGLVANGFHAMIRTTKGDDILAACGQLNTKKEDLNEALHTH